MQKFIKSFVLVATVLTVSNAIFGMAPFGMAPQDNEKVKIMLIQALLRKDTAQMLSTFSQYLSPEDLEAKKSQIITQMALPATTLVNTLLQRGVEKTEAQLILQIADEENQQDVAQMVRSYIAEIEAKK